MSKKTIRNLVAVTIILTVTLAAFLGAGYLLLSKEKTLKAQLVTYKNEQEQENLYLRLEKLALDSQEKRQQLQEPFISQKGDIAGVLLWIEEAARQSNITYDNDTLKEVVDKEARTEWVEIAVSFSGTQQNVERFLAVLENLPYLSHVSSVNMTARSSTNWEVTATLRILLFKPS